MTLRSAETAYGSEAPGARLPTRSRRGEPARVRNAEDPRYGFVWSGDFSVAGLPTSHAELIAALGMDGSESVDITGDAKFQSHLWNMEDTTPLDAGNALVTADIITNSGVGVSTDSDFGPGPRAVTVYDGLSDYHLSAANRNIPKLQEGTTSFLFMVTGRIGDMTGGDATRGVFTQMIFGGSGIYLRYANSINRFGLSLDWGASVDVAWGDKVYAQGDIFTLFCVVDFNSGQYRVFEPGLNGDAIPGAAVDRGQFTVTQPVRFGWPGIASWDAFQGDIAQIAVVEWSDAIDAEFSQANVQRYLKYGDGKLP